MNRLLVALIIMFIFSNNLHSQALTDSTIAMIAYWKIGDQVTYEFKEVVDKLSKGEKTLETTNYDVTMTIIDSTENSYIVKWEYSNYKIDFELKQIDKDLMEICSNIPVQYRTNEMGTFETIENWREMKDIANQVFNKWISEKKEFPDSLKIGFQNMMSAMFETEEQVNHFARDLKFFHYLYGVNFDRKIPFEGVKLYTNPFIKKTMPGTQKVEVVTVDEVNWIAKIKVESGISGSKTKELMIDFAKQNMENLGIKNESEIKEDEMPEFSVKENLDCIYDIESGYILKGTYSKLTTLNADYKLTTYNYKLKK